MPVVIGALTLPDAQAAALTPMAQRIEAVLGTRIDPATVQVRPRSQMPRYRPPKPGDGPTDGRARGFWRERRRTITLADDLFDPGEPLDETFGHEVIHVLFSDWVKPPFKGQLLSLITPVPESFGDLEIAGKYIGYPASPEECCCVWGSAAIFGFDPPAYVGLYKRSIPKAKLPTLRDVLLATPAIPVPPPVPEPPPIPPQPDPCQPLRDELVAEKAKRAEIATALDGFLAEGAAIANRARL